MGGEKNMSTPFKHVSVAKSPSCKLRKNGGVFNVNYIFTEEFMHLLFPFQLKPHSRINFLALPHISFKLLMDWQECLLHPPTVTDEEVIDGFKDTYRQGPSHVWSHLNAELISAIEVR